MPTYEYACDSCKNNFEVFQKMSDAPLQTCPQCGAKIRKILSGGIGISFKGSGFYVNDSVGAASGSKDSKNTSSSPCTGSACSACTKT